MKRRTFDPDRSQQLADCLSQTINESDALALEKVYAVAAILRALGESLYDREETNYDAVLADYSRSPTWPAALILISYLPHEIRELLIRERDNPEENKRLWEEHGEKIIYGNSAKNSRREG
jgi:hypothetical protein